MMRMVRRRLVLFHAVVALDRVERRRLAHAARRWPFRTGCKRRCRRHRRRKRPASEPPICGGGGSGDAYMGVFGDAFGGGGNGCGESEM